MKTRRFFSGNALPQALMAAARYHGLPPEELAYRIYDKRHGFVTRIRRFIVEVDPAAPQRAQSKSMLAANPPTPPSDPPRLLTIPAAKSIAPARRPEGSAEPRFAPPPPGPRTQASGHMEPFLPPDEESELAAAVTMGHLLALAGLELAVRIERQPDRLWISLGGADEERLRELGEEFLDDLEQLAPRAIRGLCGRLVRCKVDGAGLRVAREDELRKLAGRAADEVAENGEAVLLEPLTSADRRIVHLALVDDARVTTESQGFGAEKRIRISPAGPPTPS